MSCNSEVALSSSVFRVEAIGPWPPFLTPPFDEKKKIMVPSY